MQEFDITIAANQRQPISCRGGYIYYYAGAAGGADPTITLKGVNTSLSVRLKPGQSIRLPAGEEETDWIVGNYANASTILGLLFIGNGDIQDNRVTGAVEIIDGGRNRTMAGQSFFAHMSQAAVAGQFSAVQLWNPANSGKNVNVEQCIAQAGAYYALFDMSSGPLSGSYGTCYSKKSGGASSSAEYRYTTQVGALIVNQRFGLSGQVMPFKEPIVLTPGYGLILSPPVQNQSINFDVEFFEESV